MIDGDFSGDSNAIARLKEPIHWLESLEAESPEVTQHKIARATALGVPAVLFTAEQVSSRIAQIATLEIARHTEEDYGNPLYVILEKGGGPLATDYFSNLGMRLPRTVIEFDDFGVRPTERYGQRQLKVEKPFAESTRLSDKDVVLIDVAVRGGTTLEAIHEAFTDRVWTVHHRLGSTAASVGARVLTQREGTVLSAFNVADIDVGFWAPDGVETAGKGANDEGESLRWQPDILISRVQDRSNRQLVGDTLEALGERAIMGLDDIIWK